MALSNDILYEFAKITNDNVNQKTENTVYGTAVEYDGGIYVRLDGSDRLTPITTTTDIVPGDRVMVLIKNHTATVTGNISSPSARLDEVKEVKKNVENVGSKISEFEIVIANKVDTEILNAEKARIDALTAENVTIKEQLTANTASIDTLEADNATINEKLTANEADITNLKTNKLDVTIAEAKYATIENLNATNTYVYNFEATYGEFAALTATRLDAHQAFIDNADLKYANIDFSNIGKAAMEYFYSQSGLIENVVVGDAAITGKLIGVTLSGDLIEGNTIVAEKLVIKGTDGLYYKLNTDGITTETEQTDYNSLNGQIIKANSITASKIAVDDLIAFDATIGGFNIGENSLYSGVKDSVNNTTRGVYLDTDGQIAFGDSTNFIKYYRDQNGDYQLEITAKSIKFGVGGTSVEEAIDDLKDEIATLLHIESSRGMIFRSDQVSTVLSVVIYHGTQRITDSTTLKATFGSSAYLQWKWRKINDETYGIISASDSRFSDDGFTFTLSSEDVDTKVTFMCELIV